MRRNEARWWASSKMKPTSGLHFCQLSTMYYSMFQAVWSNPTSFTIVQHDLEGCIVALVWSELRRDFLLSSLLEVEVVVFEREYLLRIDRAIICFTYVDIDRR